MTFSHFHGLILAAVAFSGSLETAEANAYRGNLRAVAMGKMSAADLRATVLEEVIGALGNGSRVTDKRLSAIEEVLRPTFDAMPKNEHGNLEDAAARYVLHRLFVQRHAMYIRGLDAGSTVSMSTAEILEDHIPTFVLSLFEDRMKNQGLGLHEMTVLAATLEHLIHDEAVSRLQVVYQAYNKTQEMRLDEFELQHLIETYMAMFVTGQLDFDSTNVAAAAERVQETYPGWKDTTKFVRQVKSEIIASKASDPAFAAGNFSFQAATQIVEEIGERYGRWQNSECTDLKELLMKIEDHGSGRVLLKDFYKSALGGNWQFTEKEDYLRETGVLDDSYRPKDPAVVIPNYVNAPSNCLASSSIYQVCCINECEALMAPIEQQVGAHEATTERILEIVSKLASSTVPAPRELPKDLRDRLEDIANHHAGTVPLHGRLFAQWLHHAYPRECPYPHEAGSKNPMTADEWLQEKKTSTSSSVTEIRKYVEQAEAADDSKNTTATAPKDAPKLPWSPAEELIARHVPKKQKGLSWVRKLAFVIASMSGLVAMFHTVSGSLGSLFQGSKHGPSILPYVKKQHAC
eukprot:TRINITY_DN2759_c0_g1_i5.p1 TRINITY_DN2759_c0_g1~~TRINITY_DN2759_c0_g1_i5.p1  ORF type:complete len:608 (-),score=128.55 TRINITY_DN2759_c0_g1_i5:227-1951(-)